MIKEGKLLINQAFTDMSKMNDGLATYDNPKIACRDKSLALDTVQ